MAFDIESPQNFDTTSLANFSIGCAGTVRSDGEKKTWFNTSLAGKNRIIGALLKNILIIIGEIGKEMTKEELVNLVEYLHSAHNEGYKIVTWNGLGKVLHIHFHHSIILSCRV